MWRTRRSANNTGCQRLTAAEDIGVNLLRRDAQGGEGHFHVRHETRWAAEVKIRPSRHACLVESRLRQATGRIKILPDALARRRPAVAHIAARMRQCVHKTTSFIRECVVLPIVGAVEPPYLPRRARCGQRVQHGKNRRHAYSSAEQHQRTVSRLQDKTAARRADVECIAHMNMFSRREESIYASQN